MSHPPPELARALTPSCNDEDVLAVLKWRTSNEGAATARPARSAACCRRNAASSRRRRGRTCCTSGQPG